MAEPTENQENQENPEVNKTPTTTAKKNSPEQKPNFFEKDYENVVEKTQNDEVDDLADQEGYYEGSRNNP